MMLPVVSLWGLVRARHHAACMRRSCWVPSCGTWSGHRGMVSSSGSLTTSLGGVYVPVRVITRSR
jgi:hypothetical protein